MNPLFNLLRLNAHKGGFRAEGNTIYLDDVIVSSEEEASWLGGVSSQAVVRTLRGMTGPVAIRINSPGGDVMAARVITQAMREYEGEITAHIDGLAASAASIVAVAAEKVVMAPGSLMMIHNAWTIAIGNASDLLATAALLEKVDGQIADSYAARGTGDSAHYAALMAAETWMTPEEAVAEGLADQAIEERPKSRTKAAWDLSAFAHAPELPAADEEPIDEGDTEPAADAGRIRRMNSELALRTSA